MIQYLLVQMQLSAQDMYYGGGGGMGGMGMGGLLSYRFFSIFGEFSVLFFLMTVVHVELHLTVALFRARLYCGRNR